MLDQLSAPFPTDAVSWRAQQLVSNNTKALALAYIDARDVMRRLDEVCGPENWEDAYVETAKGRLICTLKIRTAQGWVSKSDGAGDTDVEGAKGGLSDAFKRAAVKWGIGRYLYETDTIFAPCEVNTRGDKSYWKAWKPEALRMFDAALEKAAKATHSTPDKPKIDPDAPISDAARDKLAMLITASGSDIATFCRVNNLTTLKELTNARATELAAPLKKAA